MPARGACRRARASRRHPGFLLLALLAALAPGPTLRPAAGQAFRMSMEEVVSWGGMIVVARVDSIGWTRTYESEVMTCLVDPFSSLLPHEDPLLPFDGTYTRLEPGISFDEDGNQHTEWPVVTGSGYEGTVIDGDTVIVFLLTGEIEPEVENGILRIEPMVSAQALVDHLVSIAD